MKTIFTLLLLVVLAGSNAQTICGTANEGGVVTLTAPAGYVIVSIDFASYGTPNGSCGSFTIGGCHASNSVSICSTAFVGQNAASINATNAVFGDPCSGTVKRLYVQATYGSTLPLTLISFTAKKYEKDKVKLGWLTAHEVNTSHFLVERSADGALFEAIGSVPANGPAGNYSFVNTITAAAPVYYYRLKMTDKDGKYRYSNIVRINNELTYAELFLFPNPAKGFITIISNKGQEALVTNYSGQALKKIKLQAGNQTLNISGWDSGVYIIKTETAVLKFIKE